MSASYVRPMFKRVSSIIGNLSVTGTATPKTIGGLNITVNVLTGNLWINPLGTAAADATSIKLVGTGTNSIDLNCDTLSLISDGTGATVQIIVWED